MGGRSHLHQCLLHGGPVRHPPSTLQDEVRVYMTFGLAVLCQGFPLVQFLRAPRTPGSWEVQLPTHQQIEKAQGTLIYFHSTEKNFLPPREGWAPVGSQAWSIASSTCPLEGTAPWNIKNCLLHSRAQSPRAVERQESLFLQQALLITQAFKTVGRVLFVLFSMESRRK